MGFIFRVVYRYCLDFKTKILSEHRYNNLVATKPMRNLGAFIGRRERECSKKSVKELGELVPLDGELRLTYGECKSSVYGWSLKNNSNFHFLKKVSKLA